MSIARDAAATAHAVTLAHAASVVQGGGVLGYVELGRVGWSNYAFAEVAGSFDAATVPPGNQLRFRITSTSPGAVNSIVDLDFIEVISTRALRLEGGVARVAAVPGRYEFILRGSTDVPVAYDPATLRRIELRQLGNSVRFTNDIAAPSILWVAESSGYASVADIAAKCGYGIMIYAIARAKMTAEDEAAIAAPAPAK